MATTHTGGLIAELSRRASLEGANTGAWPGLTIYRFTSPGGPTWEEIQAIAAAESASNPVSAVLEYVRGHLSEPLTVADLAEQVSLSPSAFAHLFREVTGRSPYQFVKEIRLDKARELLIDGQLTVARVAQAVGYASVSHFISEFRGRFGVTPRTYSDAHALHRELRVQRDDPADDSGNIQQDRDII